MTSSIAAVVHLAGAGYLGIAFDIVVVVLFANTLERQGEFFFGQQQQEPTLDIPSGGAVATRVVTGVCRYQLDQLPLGEWESLGELQVVEIRAIVAVLRYRKQVQAAAARLECQHRRGLIVVMRVVGPSRAAAVGKNQGQFIPVAQLKESARRPTGCTFGNRPPVLDYLAAGHAEFLGEEINEQLFDAGRQCLSRRCTGPRQ